MQSQSQDLQDLQNKFRFLTVVGLGLAAAILVSLVIENSAMADDGIESEQFVFISSGKEKKIFRCLLNLETGELTDKQVAVDELANGFLALHPQLPVLYAATNEPEFAKQRKGQNGGIRAYSIDTKTGELKFLNKVSTHDRGNTHIEVSHDGKTIMACHYGGDGTCAIPLDKQGLFVDRVSKLTHSGESVHPNRQKRHHPHGIAIHKEGAFACVADLGNDHVEVFSLNDAKIEPHSRWKAKPGAGPRHASFHPNGKWLYSINELDSTISVLEFDSEKGELVSTQNVKTLPEDWKGESTTAEVVIHPNGKFLFGSNRGHNSTAVFRIDENGKLKLVEHEPTGGDHPRHVGLDPTGKIYIAANMRADNMLSFHIDSTTGKLEPTGHQLSVGGPMCVVFVPRQ